MNALELKLPEPVRLRAQAQGEVGKRWIADLNKSVAYFENEWSIQIGKILTGGSESLVVEADCRDGTSAVLKIGLPGTADLSTEAQVYRLADGRGYAKLIAHNDLHNALLLERLDRPLAALDLSFRQQMNVLCHTLQDAWISVDETCGLMTGAEKARWLATYILDTWHELKQPCDKRTVEQALSFAEDREAAFAPDNSVLVHGDSHTYNALTVPESGQHSEQRGEVRCKFVDPDGLFAEKAYDLAMPMREYNDELLSGDALELGWERCQFLAELTGVDEEAIWQWGFIERVSTGLVLLQIGMKDEGVKTLAVADLWFSP